MKPQWVSPPGWPAPPYPGWSPPPGWQPDPAWPAPPTDWQYWRSVPAPPVSSRTRGGAAVAAVGAVLAIVGAFGTWITANYGQQRVISVSGFQGGRDGPFVFAFALVVLGIAVPRIARVTIPIWLDFLAAAAAAVLVVICIVDTVGVHRDVHDALQRQAYLTGGVGVGLKLALVGSLVALAGSVAAIDVRRRGTPVVRI